MFYAPVFCGSFCLERAPFTGSRACRCRCFCRTQKPLVQEFRYEIEEHVEDRHQIFVPFQGFRKVIPKQRGEGRKDSIIGQNLQHGHGHVCGRMKGEFAVERKIPDDAQQQGDQVAGPIAPCGDLVEQRKAAKLDQPRTGGKTANFINLSASFIVLSSCSHRLFYNASVSPTPTSCTSKAPHSACFTAREVQWQG